MSRDPWCLAARTCETCKAPFVVTQEDVTARRVIWPDTETDDLIADVTECRRCLLGLCEGCPAVEMEAAFSARAVTLEGADAPVIRVLCAGCLAALERGEPVEGMALLRPSGATSA